MTALKSIKILFLSWLIIPILLVGMLLQFVITYRPVAPVEAASGVVHTAKNMLGKRESAPELPQFHALQWDGNAVVTFWFDDAYASTYDRALPILEKYNYTAALAVPTSAIGRKDYMRWNDVKDLQKRGWEITSHTKGHSCNVKDYTVEFAKEEVNGSLRELNKHGIWAENFVPPCGIKSKALQEIVRHRLHSYRTSDDGLNSLPFVNGYNLQAVVVQKHTTMDEIDAWIREAQASKSWLILVFHQIDPNELDQKYVVHRAFGRDVTDSQYAIRENVLQDIVNKVENAHIPVVLPNQAVHMSNTWGI